MKVLSVLMCLKGLGGSAMTTPLFALVDGKIYVARLSRKGGALSLSSFLI